MICELGIIGLYLKGLMNMKSDFREKKLHPIGYTLFRSMYILQKIYIVKIVTYIYIYSKG